MHCVLTDGWEVFIPFACWSCILMSAVNVIRPGLEMHVNVGCKSQTSTLHWFHWFKFSFCCFHVSFFVSHRLHWKQTLFCKYNLTQVCFYWFKTQVSSSYARGRKYDGGSRSLSLHSPPDRLGAERSQNTVHCQAAKAVHLPVTPSDWQDPGVIFSTLPD